MTGEQWAWWASVMVFGSTGTLLALGLIAYAERRGAGDALGCQAGAAVRECAWECP